MNTRKTEEDNFYL